MEKNFCQLAFLTIFLAVVPFFVVAEDLEAICERISSSENSCQDMTATECRATLEKCAAYYDQQSVEIAKDITKTQQQKDTLKNQISALRKKVTNLQYQINQGNLMVKDLNLQIDDTQESIDQTSVKIKESQDQMASILRTIAEEDKKSPFIILLEGSLSDYFDNLSYLENLNTRVSDLLESTSNLKNYLENQRNKMDDERLMLEKTIKIQSLQKQENEQNKKQQETYLKLTEAQYQQQVKEKQEAEKNATKIKSRLFQIAGVSKLPTFQEALDVAKTVSIVVPIRPAFLLAVISQESAIGRNVGRCLLVDSNTGVGKRISNGSTVPNLLKPTRDLQPFLQITSSLDRDPYNSILSCPITSRYDGGSMGPAQFLPSTWNLFVNRLKSLFGVTADPWGIKDSFTASAMYLSDLGAGKQSLIAEQNAAYSYNGSGYAAKIYSRSVMTRANCIQGFIDNGTMSTECQNLIF